MTDALDRAEAELGAWLPHVVGAVAVLVLGLVFAWIAGALTRRLLTVAGLDRAADRHGVHETLSRAGVQPPLSLLAGRVVRIMLALVVVVATVSILGIGGVQPVLNEALLFLPRLVAALVLLGAGVVVGQVVGAWADRIAKQLAVDAPAGLIASSTVIVLFVVTALAQIGVPTTILLTFAALVLVVAGLTLALAFGLGGRDVAAEITAGRYVAATYRLDQRVALNGVSGTIVAFESVALVIRSAAGEIVRIPNRTVLPSVVSADPPPEETV